ncbi:MAG TPA: rod shape-determining protein RodA [Bacteroidales bacterium]|jgi:rod shape determining protein RodA|nr:rod shape-determining protein RodA [Bacteroidales bacterium]MCZ2417035.1 rod shape-determining protein RodA [Burkholderiales bacterium]OQC56978.1 MAG: Rod shape-determining protein RodA [Bacteroidetes bacterium ADurb.Bin013]MBP8999610.1 rod shape-determining protein RodA [Bacteroidales bacterium]MBV6456232.1 putative lipid II flippase FtsW [Bacteroidales bacterium]
MMRRNDKLIRKLDWWTVATYMVLVLIGWISVFAAVYDPEHAHIFDTSQRYGLQMIWILGGWFLAVVVLLVPARVYALISNLIYIIGLLLLLAVLVFGVERGGSNSWLVFGPVHFQPAEMTKVFVAIGLAGVMSRPHFHIRSWRGLLQVTAMIVIPAALILLEKETGLALVLSAFIIVLYREGLPGWIPVTGIVAIILFLLSIVWDPLFVIWLCLGVCFIISLLLSSRKMPVLIIFGSFAAVWFLVPLVMRWFSADLFSYMDACQWLLALAAVLVVVLFIIAMRKKIAYLKILLLCFVSSIILIFSVGYIFNNILKPHQQARIETLLGIDKDIYGTGYNVHQSKVAIGSGGFAGKGFLHGTQTKYNFVPEQSTDFIFCTIGEEWGFLGASLVIFLYTFLLVRIIRIAERQRQPFCRIYGYGVASCIFFHVFINIGMTIGITPVIGITLPFISYGGSSLWTFTLLLFILLKMDASND